MCNKFFVDDGGNDGWKIVLRREPQTCRALSKVNKEPEMQTLQIGRDAKHHGLRDISTVIDIKPGTPTLTGCKVLTMENVNKALEVMEEDLDLQDNVVHH